MRDALAGWLAAMMTVQWLAAVWSMLAGGLLGVLFYGGLWWTVQHAATFRRPARALLLSALLRVGATLAGLYLVAGNNWLRLVLCLMSFGLARAAVTWCTRLPPPPKYPQFPPASAETHHAP